MKNVLITGACGFIGSNFMRKLLETEKEVFAVAFDALTYAGRLGNLPDSNADRRSFIEGNICDSKKVSFAFEKLKIDTVVNFAAETHVDRSIHGPEAFIKTNIDGTFVLLEAARKSWAGRSDVRFHHVSTDEVYGSLGAIDEPFRETTPYDPSSPYSASKAAADHLVRAYHRTYALPITISNCSNNYGPYQYPEKLIPVAILNALDNKEIPLYGDGKQVRDWLYVEDHCDAILAILKKAPAGKTYNVGGNNEMENTWIVKAICKALDELHPGRPSKLRLIKHISDRPGHDRRYSVDATKIKEELGWEPKHSFSEGLRKTIDWYRGNKDWVKGVQSRGDHSEWIKRNYEKRAK